MNDSTIKKGYTPEDVANLENCLMRFDAITQSNRLPEPLSTLLDYSQLDNHILAERDILDLTENILLSDGDFIETANSIGVTLKKASGEVSNLYYYKENRWQLALGYEGEAITFGDNAGEMFAFSELQPAISFYVWLNATDTKAQIIVSPEPKYFSRMLQHYVQSHDVNVFCNDVDFYRLQKNLKLRDTKGSVTLVKSNLVDDIDENGEPNYIPSNFSSWNELLSDKETLTRRLGGYQWQEPLPINHTLPRVKQLTGEMMPKLLFDYVVDNATRLNTPLEFVAIPLIVSLGSVIGTKVSIFPNMFHDWEIIPNLWGVIIGNPSSRKSPSLDAGTKAIANLVHLAKDAHNDAKKAYEVKKMISKEKGSLAEKELKELAKQAAAIEDNAEKEKAEKELQQKAELIIDSKEEENAYPALRRYIVDDSTPEKLGELLNQNPNGLLLKQDELAGFLGRLDQHGNAEERNFYLECYNGKGSKPIDRIGRGSFIVENLCLSVIGTTQPDNITKYLDKVTKSYSNDGLIQRFQLMVQPDAIRGKGKDLLPNKELRTQVYDLFERIDKLQIGDFIKYGANAPDEFTSRPYFRFKADAYELFDRWQDELQQKIYDAEDSGLNIIAEHLGKYGKTVPSLALIFHLVDCVEFERNIGGVSKPALQAAINFAELLESHMIRIYSVVTDNATLKASILASRLLNMISKPDANAATDWLKDGFTARQVVQKGWKSLTDGQDVQTAIDVLYEHKWLRFEVINSTPNGGRPSEKFYINPKIKRFIK